MKRIPPRELTCPHRFDFIKARNRAMLGRIYFSPHIYIDGDNMQLTALCICFLISSALQ
jgi:hypothetical protein